MSLEIRGQRGTRASIGRIGVAALWLATALLGPGASALDFTVNDTRDLVDGNPGDGICSVEEPPPASPTCTLRAAIQEGEVVAGRDYIDLPAGLFQLTLVGQSEDAGATGDLDITDSVDITGAGADLTIIDGYAFDRVFDVIDGQLFLTDLTVRNGRAPSGENGGAIRMQAGFVSAATRVRIQASRAVNSDGGGCYCDGGPWHFTDVEISDNFASGRGGGLYLRRGNFRMDRLSVTSNQAGSYGGGLYYDSTSGSDLDNSTFSGNAAGLGGGGIYSPADRSLRAEAVTVVDNSTGLGDGGGVAAYSGDSTFAHTVIANNHALSGVGPDCHGELGDEFNVVIGDPSGCTISAGAVGVVTGVNPRLGALGFNSGFSKSHLPLYASPLVDAGSIGECARPEENPLLLDQRGAERPAGGSEGICDIGAVELQPGDELYAVDCMSPGASWSPLSRGFYLEGFPGRRLGEVEISYLGTVAGWYRVNLVARLGSYAGSAIGNVVSEQFWYVPQEPIVFEFEDLAVPQGGTIAFTQTTVASPAGGELTYNDGSCPADSGEACAMCPGLFQTEHSTGDLGEIRQGGVAVRITVPEPASGAGLVSVVSVIGVLVRGRRHPREELP